MTSPRVSRRVFVGSAALGAVFAQWGVLTARADGPKFGKSSAFSFEALIERARVSAQKPYREPPRVAPEILAQLDYEQLGKIHYRAERALDADGPGAYPTTFFHLGGYFQKPVKMHSVQGGKARELVYSTSDFDMPADSPAHRLPKTIGFAGFHVHESRARSDWRTQDWVAFMGASYLRSIGSLNQYGLSARGIAVNTTGPVPEEFPAFSEFYLESPSDPARPFNVYAYLDGPSISGAYRFACKRQTGVVMDVDCALFVRREIAQLGIAPLTSMFWYAEYDKGFRVDWRPEIHDSDGLALWTGAGERMWRPLNNASRTITSSFVDRDPRGFALLQRDRVSDHYLDGVNYEWRPSLWVEPLGRWGAGSVQLVEIPTDDEVHDNIVAFWVPAEKAQVGKSYRFAYRLFWQGEEPYPAQEVGYVCATRIGRGGQPGKPRPKGVTKFAIEFAGKPIEALPPGAKVTPQITASRGSVSNTLIEPVPHTKRIRAEFDLTVSGTDPVELRLYLTNGQQALSETWAYQFEPRS